MTSDLRSAAQINENMSGLYLVPKLSHPMVADLVSNRYITILEIDKYDIWQLIQLYEIVAYKKINKLISQREATKERE